MAKERSPAKARAALDTVFAAARLDLAALAQKHVFNASDPLGSLKDVLSPNALLQTPLAERILNFTTTEGTALASLLPDHLGPLPLNRTYIQARAAPRRLSGGRSGYLLYSVIARPPGQNKHCMFSDACARMCLVAQR